jgi:AcrR family transcriptional regulator
MQNDNMGSASTTAAKSESGRSRADREVEPRSSREAILDQAASCFALAGYRGTSMRDIASASNMLAGSLYSHFTSKLQILQELMESYFALLLPQQRAVAAGPGSALERLQQLIAVEVGAAHSRPEVAMVVSLDWHVIVTTPELSDVVAMARESHTLLIRVIEEGIRNREIREDVNSEAMARMLGIAVTGLIDRRYLIPSAAGGRGTDFTAEQIIAAVNSLVVHGITREQVPRKSSPKAAASKSTKRK